MLNNEKFYDLLKEDKAKNLYSRLSKKFNFKLIKETAAPQEVVEKVLGVLRKYFGRNAKAFEQYKAMKFAAVVEDLKLSLSISDEIVNLLKNDNYLLGEYRLHLGELEDIYTSALKPEEILAKVEAENKKFANEIAAREQQFSASKQSESSAAQQKKAQEEAAAQQKKAQEEAAAQQRKTQEAAAAKKELDDAARMVEENAEMQRAYVDEFNAENPGELKKLAVEAAKTFPRDTVKALRKLAESLLLAKPELKTVENAILGLSDKNALKLCRIGQLDKVLMTAEKSEYYQKLKILGAVALVLSATVGVAWYNIFTDPQFSWAFKAGAWWNDCGQLLETKPNSPQVGDILLIQLEKCYKWKKETNTLTFNQSSNYDALYKAVSDQYKGTQSQQGTSTPKKGKYFIDANNDEFKIVGEDKDSWIVTDDIGGRYSVKKNAGTVKDY